MISMQTHTPMRLKNARRAAAGLTRRAGVRWGDAAWAAALAVLLCGAPPFGAPVFGLAALSAALTAGRGEVCALAALAAGAALALTRTGQAALYALTGGTLAIICYAAAKRAPFLRRLARRTTPECLCSLCALISAALSEALLRGAGLAAGIAGPLAAMALAGAMRGAFLIKRGRLTLLGEEKIALGLIGCALIITLSGLGASGRALALALGGLAALFCALHSAGAAAVAGIVFGAALAIGGQSPFIALEMGAAGIAAALVKRLGRAAMALCFSAAVCACAWATGQLTADAPILALPAALAVCLAGEGARARVSALLGGEKAPDDAGRALERALEDAGDRMRAMAALLDEMALSCAPGARAPGEQALLGDLRARLCEGCGAYERCWGGADSRAGRLLCLLLGDALRERAPLNRAQMPPEICRQCRRAPRIPEALRAVVGEFESAAQLAREQGEARVLLGAQLGRLREMLFEESQRLTHPRPVNRHEALRARAALEEAGMRPGEVFYVDDGAPQLFVALSDNAWTRDAANRAARALSKALGQRLRAQPGPVEGLREARFEPAPLLKVEVGYAARAQDGVNGDSHLTCELPGARVLLAISDGMGSGARAARESSAAVRLLKRMLSAGVSSASALESVNDLLMLRGEQDMFTTADICLIDRVNCRAEFSKLCGCPSLIVRRGRCLYVEGGHLPMGILGRVKPGQTELRLYPGDLIIMASDGVSDGAREEDRCFLEAMARRYQSEPPQRLSEKILSAAVARADGRSDDMTVLAARIV